MPTFEVEIADPDFRRHSFRVPAPDPRIAKARAARRALALERPQLGSALNRREFTRIARAWEKVARVTEPTA